MTRRSLLWTMALSPTLAYSREKAAAFALIGDRYHNFDYIRTALNRDAANNNHQSAGAVFRYRSTHTVGRPRTRPREATGAARPAHRPR